jgi:4-amino-4-deoxy-L-arabinose transferase-like glycosyltransferase
LLTGLQPELEIGFPLDDPRAPFRYSGGNCCFCSFWEAKEQAMYTIERILMWIVAGACMGIGAVAFGLGGVPFFFGLVLAVYGVRRIGPRGLWITLVAMGVAPIILVSYTYFTAEPSATSPSNPIYSLSTVFGPIMIIGIVWGVVEARRNRRMA